MVVDSDDWVLGTVFSGSLETGVFVVSSLLA